MMMHGIEVPFLADLLGQGPLHPIMLGLALLGMLVTIGIWVMELSGRTISRRGLVRNNVPWDTATIALIVASAAIFIATRPLHLQVLPRIGEFTPIVSLAPTLAPIFSVLFGLPGAIGMTLGFPISQLIYGGLSLETMGGFLSYAFVTWLPYRMVRELKFKKEVVGRYYLWAILVGPVIHVTVTTGWLDFIGARSPAMAWGMRLPSLLINHSLLTVVSSPILLIILYPFAKLLNLCWWNRYLPEFAR